MASPRRPTALGPVPAPAGKSADVSGEGSVVGASLATDPGDERTTVDDDPRDSASSPAPPSISAAKPHKPAEDESWDEETVSQRRERLKQDAQLSEQGQNQQSFAAGSSEQAATNDLEEPEGTGEVGMATMDEPTVEEQARPAPPLSVVRDLGADLDEGAPTRVAPQAKLLIIGGNDRGREFGITQNHTTVGRGIDNDIVLTDIAVSRHHMVIEFDERRFVVRDLGSGNGTLRNNKQAELDDLTTGDQLEIGNTLIRFETKAGPQPDLAPGLGIVPGSATLDENPGRPAGTPALGAPPPPPLAPPPQPLPAPPSPVPTFAPALPTAPLPKPREPAAPRGGLPPPSRSKAPTAPPLRPSGGNATPPQPPTGGRYPGGARQATVPQYPAAPRQPTMPQFPVNPAFPPGSPLPPITGPLAPLGGHPGAHLRTEPVGRIEGAALLPPVGRPTDRRHVMIWGASAIFGAILLVAIVSAFSKDKDPKTSERIAAIDAGFGFRATPQPTKPATAEPATAEPATAEPATAEPATAEPATAEPATAEPATAEPEPSQPAVIVNTPVAKPKPAAKPPVRAAPAAKQPPKRRPPRARPAPKKPPRTKRTATTTGSRSLTAAAAKTARHSASVQYGKKKFDSASSVLRDAAQGRDGSEADRLLRLADDYAAIGRNIDSGDAKRSARPADAMTAYKKALTMDRKVGGGTHQAYLRRKIGEVAPKAAASYMAQERYESAKRAADTAVNYGSGSDPMVGRVRRGLEKKAGELYQSAYKLRKSDAKQSRSLLKRVLKIVPPTSKWYTKAYAALNRSKRGAGD